jgi:hypothetical protein
MKTRDEAIRDLAERAKDQAEALYEKMDAIATGFDNEGDPEMDQLCGIGKDRDGRAQMIFAEQGAPRGHRFVVYVDCILALAKLLNGEVQVPSERVTEKEGE